MEAFLHKKFLKRLYELVRGNPCSNKRELLALIELEGFQNITTRDINRILYSYRSLFRHSGESLPLWSARTVEESFWNVLNQVETDRDLPKHYNGPKPFSWQKEAYEAWIKAGRCGVIEAVTGTGKTMVGILAATDASSRGLKTLVVVPGIELLNQWFEKFIKNTKGLIIGKRGGGFDDEMVDCDVLIATVQTASKYYMLPGNQDGLLIADEVHHFGADEFRKALEEGFSERLGLTATYEREDTNLEKYLSPYFKPLQPRGKMFSEFPEVVAGCTYARGLSENILAHFRVGLIPVEFSVEEMEEYLFVDGKASKLKRKLINVHGCPDSPFGEFIKQVNILSQGGNDDLMATLDARGYLSYFTKRRKLLAGNKKKIDAIEKLAPVLINSNNTLIFTETKERAALIANKLLDAGIEAHEFSSRLSKNERKTKMKAFEEGDIKALVAPRVLDEGIDVPEANLGIIISASRSQRQMIQRMGRIIRPKKDKRQATFFLIYVKDTYEDPEWGAHEAFLTEMKDNADEVMYFSLNHSLSALYKWYSNNQ